MPFSLSVDMAGGSSHGGFVTVRLDFKFSLKVFCNLNITSWHRLLVGENALLPPDTGSGPGLCPVVPGPVGWPALQWLRVGSRCTWVL